MILSSETSHQFWMQKLNVPIAIATRQIVAKGSVQKALKLIPALKPAFALYPGILTQMGREDLLQMKLAKKKKRRFKLFKKGPYENCVSRMSGTLRKKSGKCFVARSGESG